MSDVSSSPRLREMQEWMRWVITDPRGVSAALLEPRPAGLGSRYQAPTPDAREAIRARDTAEREVRLSVYAEGYFQRILSSLEEDFPATVRLMGKEDFARLINDYLKVYPSNSFTLADVGRELSRFTAHERPDEPWLQDLIDLEWQMIETFYAPTVTPLGAEDLSTISADADWASAKYRFVPGVSVHLSQWPVAEFRLRTFEPADFARAPKAPHWSLLYLSGRRAVELEKLDASEAICLNALMTDESLEAALAKAAEATPEGLSEATIGSWFGRWMSQGLIHEIRF